MRLKFAALCRYATYTEHSEPTLVGVFDVLFFQGNGQRLMPPSFLVVSLSATSFEAGKHGLTVRIIDGDGVEGARREIPVDELVWMVDPIGSDPRSLNNIPIDGLTFPHPGEFAFEILYGSQRLGDVRILTVDL